MDRRCGTCLYWNGDAIILGGGAYIKQCVAPLPYAATDKDMSYTNEDEGSSCLCWKQWSS